MNALRAMLKAQRFARERHRGQCRKGADREPFVEHPLRVADRLVAHGLEDPVLLQAAVLHDVLEDTPTPVEELREEFGDEVAGIVLELTDDKNLLKSLRKQTQVERAPTLSLRARLIRIADKIDNVEGLVASPPLGWNLHRQREYVAWSRRVVRGIRGTHAGLEAEFDRAAKRAMDALTAE